jgi:adenylyltransferase and sulfurtransferase
LTYHIVVFVLCRRGNSSVTGTKLLLEMGFKNVYNVIGGLQAWKAIDPEIPHY